MTRSQKMMIHVSMWMRRLFTRENMSIASRCVKELLSNVLVALCVGKSILEKTGIWFGAAAASLASQLMSYIFFRLATRADGGHSGGRETTLTPCFRISILNRLRILEYLI